MFGKHWEPAQGTVVASRISSTTGDGMVSTHEFVVDVRTSTGEVFRAKVDEPRIATDFMAPRAGAQVRVEYDDKSRKVRFDKDDPSLSWKHFKEDRKSNFDALLEQPPGSAPAPLAGLAAQGFSLQGLQNAGLGQVEGLIQAAAAQGGVIRLDSTNPDVAALREMLLKAAGGQPPAAPEVPPST